MTSLAGPAAPAVRAEAQGFSVRNPTGRVTLAAGLVGVWEALRGRSTWPGPDAGRLGDGVVPGRPDSAGPEAVADGGARMVLHVGACPGAVTELWAPDIVLREAGPEVLARRLAELPVPAGRRARVLVHATPDEASAALRAVTDPGTRLRATLVAVVRHGDGPSWADDLRGVGAAAADEVLAGLPRQVQRRPGVSVPAAAAWMAGRVACGSTAGTRLAVVVGPDVVLDAADGHGIAVRRVPEVHNHREADRAAVA